MPRRPAVSTCGSGHASEATATGRGFSRRLVSRWARRRAARKTPRSRPAKATPAGPPHVGRDFVAGYPALDAFRQGDPWPPRIPTHPCSLLAPVRSARSNEPPTATAPPSRRRRPTVPGAACRSGCRRRFQAYDPHPVVAQARPGGLAGGRGRQPLRRLQHGLRRPVRRSLPPAGPGRHRGAARRRHAVRHPVRDATRRWPSCWSSATGCRCGASPTRAPRRPWTPSAWHEVSPVATSSSRSRAATTATTTR